MAAIEYVDGLSVPSAVPLILEGCRHIIVLKTFSKIHGMAGIRVGYGLAAAEDHWWFDAISRRISYQYGGDCRGSRLFGWSGFSFLLYQMVKEGRDYLTKEMKKLGCKVYLPQTSFFYFGAHMDPQKLKAQKRNILIGAFDFPRVSIGSQVQNAAFLSCLKEIWAQKE